MSLESVANQGRPFQWLPMGCLEGEALATSKFVNNMRGSVKEFAATKAPDGDRVKPC